jgi:hypothetical protein
MNHLPAAQLLARAVGPRECSPLSATYTVHDATFPWFFFCVFQSLWVEFNRSLIFFSLLPVYLCVHMHRNSLDHADDGCLHSLARRCLPRAFTRVCLLGALSINAWFQMKYLLLFLLRRSQIKYLWSHGLLWSPLVQNSNPTVRLIWLDRRSPDLTRLKSSSVLAPWMAAELLIRLGGEDEAEVVVFRSREKWGGDMEKYIFPSCVSSTFKCF